MIKVYAIIAAVMLTSGIAFKLYFDYSQEQIATLNKNIQTYKIQNAAQQKVFDHFKNNITEQAEAITELNNELIDIRNVSTQLSKTLARHELDRLAGAKPETLKRLANAATKKVFAKLENITQ